MTEKTLRAVAFDVTDAMLARGEDMTPDTVLTVVSAFLTGFVAAGGSETVVDSALTDLALMCDHATDPAVGG